MSERIHLISLGCPTNRVDSEVMMGQLRDGPFEFVDSPEDAESIIVNTCSFLQSTTEESIDTILDMAKYKNVGCCQKLIVTGCMVQRYGQGLEGELPEVDFFLGTGEYHRISEVIAKKNPDIRSFIDTPMYIHDEFAPRVLSWRIHSAYLKISEGCNHRCTFCIIPTLRGTQRSRTIASLVAEAERLANQGVVELNLVSQDSTSYGRDLKDGSQLGTLLRSLARIDGIRWIRLHYAYPIGIPNSLLEVIAEEEKVCSYIDLPLQHASGPMLKHMRRGVTRLGQERILERIRTTIPNVTVRTTFIVGFPHETQDDFDILKDFVQAQQFDRVGIFTYSQEDGTEAAKMDGQVPHLIRMHRQEELMNVQAQISADRLARHRGEIVEVLVDGSSKEHELVKVGRTSLQAPDVDGVVFLDKAPEELQAGTFAHVKITQTTAHDMVGEVVST
ncbi:MAG: 30S ribosomal protein S12 methylthiotransferase RimO [Deltaproteobacteria bacterium]|nr:30S ribosomal protein S12 methylthiotransferase RimO [Deltaproteobacteria bacterium]